MITSRKLRELQSELPDSPLVLTYSAGLPVSELDIQVRILARQRMSAVQEYVMRCIANRVRTLSQIDFVLGLGGPLARATVAYLQSFDLLESSGHVLDGNVEFQLTERGKTALLDVAVKLPLVLSIPCVFEGMLGELRIRKSRSRLAGRGAAAGGAIHPLPARFDTPTATTIEKRQVQRVIRELKKADPAKLPDGEVLDVVEITSAAEKYRIVDVAVFADAAGNLTFRVIDRGVRLKEFEQQLGELSFNESEVLPVDDVRDTARFRPLVGWIGQDEVREARANADALAELEERVERIEQVELATPPEGESAAQIITTREQLEAARAELQRLRADLETGVVYIDTEEHRRLLERAFQHAKELVIMISPWLTRGGVDDEFERWLIGALSRGVEVVIGWGFPDEGNPDQKRKREQSLRTIEKLKARATAPPKKKRGQQELPVPLKGKLRIVELGDTHAKVLVADLNFAVVTSFNWGSFGGRRGGGHQVLRRENGTKIGIPERVREIRDRTIALIEAAESKSVAATSPSN